MRRASDIDALEQVLCAALGSGAPVCSLARLDHLSGAFAALDPEVVERPTLIGGGALYNPTSPAPGHDVLDALVRRAHALGAEQIVVPHVRRVDDTRALRAAGFVPVPAGDESVVRLTGDVDEALRTRIGARRLRDLRRRHHALGREVSWERIPLTGLGDKPWAREAFLELHRDHAERHGGSYNPYDAEALDALAAGPLAGRAELLVRRHMDVTVQAGLLMRSHNGRGVYYLTQAIRHGHPAALRNVYVATFYGLYLDARRDGLDWVHLGRGGADAKRRLGADLVYPLDHWVRAPGLVLPGAEGDEEPRLSVFATPPVAAAPVPGPVRGRHRPRFDTVDLSSNTNALLGAEGQYPDLDTADLATAYLDALSKLPGDGGAGELTADHVLFTSGAVDGVALLLMALTAPGHRVCVTPPTFEAYDHWARLLRLPVVEAPLRGDDLSELDTERILAADARVTFLCDPSNPVGTRLDREQVLEVVGESRGLVVVDEAYVEFSEGPSYADLLARYDNLVVLRTLSKAWGLAGARCGVVLAAPGIIEALRRVQVPFGFTAPAQNAVRARLTSPRQVLAALPRIRAERARMAAALAEHPLVDRVFPSETNFLLVRLYKHDHVLDLLRDAGILVADTSHVVADTCRITIGTRHANNTLLEALSLPSL
ncbi:aminotransferase class I/II-fold pyridoxal phosphate-dependent enzyme [Streptomyces sp. NBC_00239]|uniref:aminotransferase class I/II-fold pyridoxal phosphate-dependent enzyme n=1 Tax=Streptomyces sp. NBC_00239 TaxID=2903640 RepID=UPI002E2831DD|nr:aminotransferase class I/II-fold pyridoxal phosphate-dependent enzyme [Streptomyces sp. NBC_00239]